MLKQIQPISVKKPSKSMTLKALEISVIPMVQNSNHLMEDLKLLGDVLAA
jgi:hypothetical protein